MVKNLMIINGLFFFASWVLARQEILDLHEYFALSYPMSAHFNPIQILTHFFMHARIGQQGILHIGMNMFGLYMFGRMLEIRWGGKRFLFFYMVTAFFAAFLHFLVQYYRIESLAASIPQELYAQILNDTIDTNRQYSETVVQVYRMVNTPVVGASGAIFGILGACYVLFPNTILYLIFPPIPLRLKVAVTLYGLYELYRGVAMTPGDNVAHFAHIGGLVAGIIIVKYWNKTRRDSFF
jgi:membrane associated rhomboid family serine protease